MLISLSPEHIGYTIEDANFAKPDLEPLFAHKILKNLSVSVPLSMEQWRWIDALLGSHPNTLNLGLASDPEQMIAGRPTWERLEFLPTLANLRELTVSDIYIQDIAPVFQCAGLQSFAFMDFGQHGTLDVKGISNLQQLRSLSLFWPAEHFEEVNSLVGLESLTLNYQKKGFDISQLQNLKHLSLASVKPQATDAFLLAFPKLESLRIWGDFMGSFSAVPELKALNSISIFRNKKFEDLDFAVGMPQLQHLELSQVSGITCIPDLSHIPLQTLKIDQMKRLVDLGNLLEMNSLEVLEIVDIPDKPYSFWIEVLDRLPNLKECRIQTKHWEDTLAITKEIRSRGIQTYEMGMG